MSVGSTACKKPNREREDVHVEKHKGMAAERELALWVMLVNWISWIIKCWIEELLLYLEMRVTDFSRTFKSKCICLKRWTL